MKLLLRHQALLFLAAAVVFLIQLGGPALFNHNEARVAACSAEMFRQGDWIVPRFNDELQAKTPILIHWCMLVMFRLFGVSEFSARITSAVLSVGTTLLTYHLGRKLYSPAIGFLAGLILCTCLLFSAVGRAATPDAVLVFFVTLAFTSYVWIVARQRGGSFSRARVLRARQAELEKTNAEAGSEPTPAPRTLLAQLVPDTWQLSVPLYVAMGLAVLASGPVGVVLPCVIIALFLLTSQRIEDLEQETLLPPQGPRWRRWLSTVAQVLRPRQILAVCRRMNLFVGLAIVTAIALPWSFLATVMTGGAWLQGYLQDHRVMAALTSQDGHSGFPLYQLYHIVVIHLGCFPWSVFLPVAVFRLWERLTEGAAWRDSDRLLACWTGVWFISFSLISTNLANDLLPLYPAVALILARYLDDWRCETGSIGVYSFQICCRAQWIAGAVLFLGLCFTAYLYFPTEQWVGLAGLVPVVGALAATKLVDQEQRDNSVRVLIATALLLTLLLIDLALPRLRPYQDSPVFVEDARRRAQSADVSIATFDYFEPSLVFYAGKKVRKLDSPRQVADFIASEPHAYVVARANRYNELRDVLMGNVRELTRHRNFLTGHDLILIGPF